MYPGQSLSLAKLAAFGLRKAAALLPCMSLATGLTLAAEVPTAWQLLDDGDPNPKHGTLAYDGWRQRVVRTTTGGGSDGPPFTWELVGEDWVRRFIPESTPWGAGGACSAFDSDRGVVVLFGGVLESTTINETWEYDGTSWILRLPANSPPARIQCSMAYDSVRQVMVLFGGYSTGFNGLGDTWEYDGTVWTQISTQSSPSPRGDAGMAYDTNKGQIVLAAGRDGGTFFDDTWVYDGQRWRQKNTPQSPGARWGPGMTYDPARQKTVLFGGSSTTANLNDTWEWNGNQWNEVVTPQAPAPRRSLLLVYDAQRGKVLGHGGAPDNGGYNDTWVYDGATWTQVAISGLPAVRRAFAMAYDPLVTATVLYGGRNAWPDGDLTDTWHLDGQTWTLQPGAGGLSASRGFHLAFDTQGSRLVGFSGIVPGGRCPRPMFTNTPETHRSGSRRIAVARTSGTGTDGLTLLPSGGRCCSEGARAASSVPSSWPTTPGS